MGVQGDEIRLNWPHLVSEANHSPTLVTLCPALVPLVPLMFSLELEVKQHLFWPTQDVRFFKTLDPLIDSLS
jgi:hypothetical protein